MLEYLNYIFLTITIVQIVIVLFWVNIRRDGYFFKTRFHFLMMLTVLGIISYLLNSRFFFLSAIAGLFFLAKISGIKVKTYITILFLLSFVIMTFIKPASSAGRLLIYKLSLSRIYENLFTKADSVSFNSLMNHVQADYFSANGTNNQEAILADNIYYGFNEWLVLTVKYGLFGFIGSAVILLAFLKLYINHLKRHSVNLISLWLALLLPILVSSFISYPFQNKVILVEVFCLFGLILYDLFFKMKSHFITSKVVSISIILLSLFFISILVFKDIERKNKIEEIELLIKEGQKNNAENIIKQEFEIPSDKYVTPLYANLQYARGNVKEAINLLLANHAYQCNSSFHSSIGKWYFEIGDSVKAEANFLNALYIVPSKLSTRYVLVEFYVHYGNINKARYWADDLIRFPIKIENEDANILKRKAKYFIENNKLQP
jgi:O-antigen polymerase